MTRIPNNTPADLMDAAIRGHGDPDTYLAAAVLTGLQHAADNGDQAAADCLTYVHDTTPENNG